MENEELCYYGCGNKGIYKLKNGKKCCSKFFNSCPELKRKNSEGVKKSYKFGTNNNNHIQLGKMNGWDKFSKDKINKIHFKSGNTLSKNIKNGLTIPAFFGKHHTNETKEKISKKMFGGNNGLIKTKYYEIYSKYQNKIIKVQGTWELKFAEYLNKKNINWVRSRNINLRYKLNKKDYLHIYYPDFYLPDTNEYIEIKGYFWKSKDNKINDKRKMNKIFEYNKDKKIILYTKKELLDLNIL